MQETEMNAENNLTLNELIIEGASCASCVGKIETALKQVSGVSDAVMNFAQRTVTVEGNVTTEALVKAVEGAGYNARISEANSEDELLDQKEQADEAYYRRQ